MKICYVINSLDGGGGALPLPHVIGVMRDAGHEVFVVSLMERDGRARPLLDAAHIPYTVIGGARRRFLDTFLRLDRIVRREKPDLLWTSLSHATITGELVGALRGVPVVSWLHNAWLKPINARILRRTARLSRHWVADSQTVADFGARELGIDPAKISIWPLFRASPDQPAAHPCRRERFRLGSLGRLHVNKGYDMLIRAVAALRDRNPGAAERLSVHLAGEGGQRDALAAQAAALGLGNIHFEGFTGDPAAFLASLDGYVQPSHHEGLCIAVHEAMQAGLPIVASPVGEMARSVASSGGGTLVPYGDVDGLSRALEDMIERPDMATGCGRKARAWVLDYYSSSAFASRGRAALSTAIGACASARRSKATDMTIAMADPATDDHAAP